ncbi:MAG TPA: fatty acid oxidation complex subunit alpha FadJ [Gemmatimonadales bacterium]|jgi:3-hydroxyacyl-CoA dehydrogenase/enoyl-CoA hydratase/3-hydroxybutyryl-CoA epimerase|nr:fatty acid oxidation complex subunit alpha FadJ [Gemmatimonadales bacterium]
MTPAGPALTWEITDGIAIVTFDTPGASVNVISAAVKEEVTRAFETLKTDERVKAVAFFSGKRDNFIAGADIEEFVKLSTTAEAEQLSAQGQLMLGRIADFPKPVVAGINGACVGGGLEFALCCTYRVATDNPKTTIGLPEVTLGILPGAGGCQRLPRLIGLRAALDIILAGKTVPGKKALQLGMIDELVPPSILRRVTLDAAKKLAGGWRPHRRRPGGLMGFLLDGNPLGRQLVFRMARKNIEKQTHGNFPAPPAALDTVEYGLKHGITAGLAHEARGFGQLAVTDVSRKLVQIFFATNALKKDLGIANPPPPVDVRRLGVVGSGFMGSGIAGTAVTQAGIDVRLKDADLVHVSKGVAAARGVIEERYKRRRITRFDRTRLLALVSGDAAFTGFGRADLVIEAVFEDLKVKQQVLREVEAVIPAGAVFATNTSTIPIAEIAAASTRPGQVIGMHFFSPVPRMPLLEVIPSKDTSPGTVSTAVAFGRRMGKTPIVVKDSPGFWVNRILGPYMNEAAHILLGGTAIEDIDLALVQFGFPVGPITLLDEVGLDVAGHASEVLFKAFGDRLKPAPALEALIKAGRLGRKAGKGFYRYQGGKKQGVDEAVYPLIGVHPNGGPRAAEIVQRLTLAMVNEAALALSEGVVHSPWDGDIAAIFGFGFPPFRGGPLHYADDLGAARVVEDLERLAERLGSRFTPCAALKDQARRGGTFYS